MASAKYILNTACQQVTIAPAKTKGDKTLVPNRDMTFRSGTNIETRANCPESCPLNWWYAFTAFFLLAPFRH